MRHVYLSSLLLTYNSLVIIGVVGEADPIPCNSQAFQCNRGRCIHYRNVCDGVVDCQYGNDELDCPEYNEDPLFTRSCHEDYFQCASGQCIYKTARCDHAVQCSDGSDEDGCGFEESGLDKASLIGLTVSIAGLAVILAIIVITIFCVQRKRLSNAVQRERQRLRNLMETASDGNVRDPPPRYSSRQDLAVVNAAYNHDESHFGMAPPPYYSNGNHPTTPNDPPPSYSVHQPLNAVHLVRNNRDEDTLWNSSQTITTGRDASVGSLDRSVSLSSSGIVAGHSINDLGSQSTNIGQGSNVNENQGIRENMSVASKAGSDTKLTDSEDRQFEVRYVSSPVVSGSSSHGKIFSGQSQSAVSKSTSTLVDSKSKFDPSPMTRGHGTINLDRCISRSTPGLFDNRSVTLARPTDLVPAPSMCSLSCDRNEQCSVNREQPSTSTSPSSTLEQQQQPERFSGCHGMSHVRTIKDRSNVNPHLMVHRNIPHNSRAIPAHISGQADLAGCHGELDGVNITTNHDIDCMTGQAEITSPSHVNLHVENGFGENRRNANVLGQADLIGVAQLSPTRQSPPPENGAQLGGNEHISYC